MLAPGSITCSVEGSPSEDATLERGGATERVLEPHDPSPVADASASLTADEGTPSGPIVGSEALCSLDGPGGGRA